MRSSRLKILSVIGTRPEAIKMAPVIAEIARRTESAESVVCSTGQHQQMLDPVLELFGIVPDHDLRLMEPGQNLPRLAAGLFRGIDEVVSTVEPDWILAQGDTSTVFAASLVAFYRRVPFGHVEAGLRTNDRQNPFPEEVHRRIADLVADACFAPTERARAALLSEGYPAERIVLTGNTVIESVLEMAERPFDWETSALATLPRNQRLVLVTAHRRESFGAPFREICEAIRDLATAFADEGVHFVYPVHLNPNVRAPVAERLSGLENVSLLEPLDYLTLVQLMKRATLILTDSGGIQEEAPSLRVPTLVLRETTERPEGVEAGVVRLVGTRRAAIVSAATELLRNGAALRAMACGANPYGDGTASRKIVDHLLLAAQG